MKRSSLFTILVGILVAILAVGNNMAVYYDWYVKLWWLDIPMHVLGGFFVGLIVLWFYYDSGRIVPRHHAFFFVVFSAVSSAAFIGVIWEFYEYIFLGSTGLLTYTDTLQDLLNDIIGGLAAGLLIYQWRKKK